MKYRVALACLVASAAAQSGCDLSVPCAASGHLTMKGWKLKDKPVEQVFEENKKNINCVTKLLMSLIHFCDPIL
jgi:hypothetical protein